MNLFAILAVLALFAAAQPSKTEQRRKSHPELAALIDAAQAAPPEFTAKALLQVAASPKLKDPEWKQELLEEAFRKAALAQEPIRRKIMDGTVVAGRPMYRSQAFGLRLDRLSLQTAVVKALLEIDPQRARKLFEEIPRPAARRLQCEEALLDEPSEYYAVLADVINNSYSLREHQREEHLLPAQLATQAITSPLEVAPVAKMIGSLKLAPAQVQLLVTKSVVS